MLLTWANLCACGSTEASSTPNDPFVAAVYVDGTVDGVASANELDMRDAEGRRVAIEIQQADGPAKQFFRQTTRPNFGMTLTEADPQDGESVCVLARLTEDGKMVAWKVFLESRCQHVP